MAWAADSISVPDFTALARAGCSGWLGYTRAVRRQDVAACHAAGLWFSPIAEWGAGDALRGADVGADHGRRVETQMRALGTPPGVVVWATVDTDATPGPPGPRWNAVRDYVAAMRANTSWPLGLYAGEDIIDWLLDLREITAGWGVAASSWSHRHRSARLALRQTTQQPVYGAQIDVNDVFNMPAVWGPGGATTNQGDALDMATPAEITGPIIQAITNVQNNLAGVARDEGKATRTATVDAVVNVQNNLAALARALNADETDRIGAVRAAVEELVDAGTLPGTVDVGAVVTAVAERLTITPKI